VREDQYVPAIAVVDVPVFACYVAADVGGPQGLWHTGRWLLSKWRGLCGYNPAI